LSITLTKALVPAKSAKLLSQTAILVKVNHSAQSVMIPTLLISQLAHANNAETPVHPA